MNKAGDVPEAQEAPGGPTKAPGASLEAPGGPTKAPGGPTKAPSGLSRRQALTALGVGAGALIAEQALVADGIPPSRQPAGVGQHRAGTQRLRAGRHLGPRRRPAAEHSAAARQPVPPESGQEHHVPAVPRPRTHAALLPPELRPHLHGGAARRLGEAGLADPRPHDRAPAVRARADLRQHQRRGGQNPRPLPGQPAGRAPGPGHHGRVPPRLPVRVPRGLLRLAGAGKVGLVAVLHDPQVPGRDDRPVPAGRR